MLLRIFLREINSSKNNNNTYGQLNLWFGFESTSSLKKRSHGLNLPIDIMGRSPDEELVT